MIYKILSFIFPYRFIRGIKYFARMVYTYSVAKYMAKCGNNPNIMPDAWIEGGKYITIGDNFTARSGLRLEAYDLWNGVKMSPKILIGNNFNVGELCHIGAINSIIIGDNVLLGSKVYITDHNHGSSCYEDVCFSPLERKLDSKGPVVIEDNVWIGDNAVILPGVKIGHNSIVAANAVVTKDVPPFCIVGGVPGSVIRYIEHG